MQKHVNLVDLVKSFPTNIFLQNLASIQKRTSPLKFAHLAEKSENGSMSNLSTKDGTQTPYLVPEESRFSMAVAPDEVSALHVALEISAAPLDAVRPVAENHGLAAHRLALKTGCLRPFGDDATHGPHLGDLYAESGQTLRGSFSAAAAAVDRTIFKN